MGHRRADHSQVDIAPGDFQMQLKLNVVSAVKFASLRVRETEYPAADVARRRPDCVFFEMWGRYYGQSMLVCFIGRMGRAYFSGSDTCMNIPEWVKPAAIGAVFGAVALSIVGFSSWGGWHTRASAEEYAASETAEGIALALTPYCLAHSKNDPDAMAVLAELEAASGYNRRGVLEKAGWATPLGAEKPNSALAAACATELEETA